jgi:hypothetical protein
MDRHLFGTSFGSRRMCRRRRTKDRTQEPTDEWVWTTATKNIPTMGTGRDQPTFKVILLYREQ